MRLPLRLWKRTLAVLGFQAIEPASSWHSRDRYSHGTRHSAQRHRKLMVEQLEPLTMLTGVTVEADAPSYIEGQTAWFTFTLDQPAPQAFYLDLLLSGGPAGPTGYVLPIAQGETSVRVWLPTKDNSSSGDGYEFDLSITGSSQGGPAGPMDSASTQILNNDFIGENFTAEAEGPSGPSGPSGESSPTVVVSASGPAREVGPVPGEFVFYRSGAETTAPLTIQFTISGTATNGQDYISLPTSITIPANQPSATLVMTPITDTTIEGIETVVLTITANSAYTLGEYVQATVQIRDRAGVKKILATAGVTLIPPGPDSGRDVTGAVLELTQDDTVDFKAIPTDGGDFAPNEPTWTVTGEGATTGETRTVTFGTYRFPQQTVLTVGTPANPDPLEVKFIIVPYPTGISGTRVLPPTPGVITNLLPTHYGTVFEHTLSASSGASGQDLFLFDNEGKLEVVEHVTFGPNPPYAFPNKDDDAPISPGGLLVDTIGTKVSEVFPYIGFFPFGPTLSSPQDFLWKSNAADSLDFQNEGWHEFVTDLPITVSLSPIGTASDGWTVTTTDNGIAFTQPHSAPGLSAHLESDTTIPWGSYITVTLTGTVMLTAADVAAGSKTFEVTLYDDDVDFPDPNDPLQSVTVTVPAANGVAGMYTPWWKETILMNLPVGDIFGNFWGEVGGSLGLSGEVTAEVFFWAPGNNLTYSNIVSVTAAPMP